MKSLALMLVLAVAACSESETPLPIENPMAAPSALPHGVQYAIPEGIHPNLAAYFDDLQPHMSQREWQFILKQVHDSCYGRAVPFRKRLRYNLSERAFQYVFTTNGIALRLRPYKTLSVGDRIETAAHFLGNGGIYHVDHGQVYYTDASQLRVVELVEDRGNRGMSGLGLGKPDISHDEFISRFEPIRRFIIDNFFAGHGVQVPPIPADLDIALFVVNVDGNLLSTVHEGKGTIYPIDTVPHATDAQIEEYNTLYSPWSYDCVESDVDPDDVVIFNQLYIDE